MSVLGKNCGWVQICVAGIPTFASELQLVARIKQIQLRQRQFWALQVYATSCILRRAAL
jgi:hypothetical protein